MESFCLNFTFVSSSMDGGRAVGRSVHEQPMYVCLCMCSNSENGRAEKLKCARYVGIYLPKQNTYLHTDSLYKLMKIDENVSNEKLNQIV